MRFKKLVILKRQEICRRWFVAAFVAAYTVYNENYLATLPFGDSDLSLYCLNQMVGGRFAKLYSFFFFERLGCWNGFRHASTIPSISVLYGTHETARDSAYQNRDPADKPHA